MYEQLNFAFQKNGYNEVVIELRVKQFWSAIILMISNQTCAAYLFDFKFTFVISVQIHSTQFHYHYINIHHLNIDMKPFNYVVQI